MNRLDEIIVFRQLTKAEVKEIADIMLREVFGRALEKGIKIDVTERFKVFSVAAYICTLKSKSSCIGAIIHSRIPSFSPSQDHKTLPLLFCNSASRQEGLGAVHRIVSEVHLT